MRYFVHLCYDGTGYCGWQLQLNSETVQGRLNFALSQILSERIASMGCGRTDSGVHATDFYAHFDTEKVLDERYAFRLNSVLPADIRVYSIFPVADRAHTRFDATSRTYEYYFHFNQDPFIRHYSTLPFFREMDWDKTFEATKLIPEIKDFTSLCRASVDFKTNICNVTEARWDRITRPAIAGSQTVDMMRFTITSNRFLRGMVRMIVAALIAVGRGRITIDEFKRVLEAKETFPFAISSPPQGLYLTRVRYPYIENGKLLSI